MNKKKKLLGVFLPMAIFLGMMGVFPLSVNATGDELDQNIYVVDANGVKYQEKKGFEGPQLRSEDSVSMNTESDKTKLPTPTGVMWDGWNVKWNPVPEGKGHYNFSLYKDGNLYKAWGCSFGETHDSGIDNISSYISESGTYTYRISTSNSYNPEEFEMSEWSDFSEEKVYSRPAQNLDSTVGWWDETTPGLFHWNPVDNAGGYYVMLLYYNDEKAEYEFARGQSCYSEWYLSADFSDVIAEKGAGKYIAKVRALSGDIDTIANGEYGDASEVLDTSVNANVINDIINNALKNFGNDASQILNELRSKVTPAQLASAMQTDSDIQQKMRELEALYTSQKGVSVSGVSVSKDVEKYVDSTKISTIGSGLNARDNSSIGLKVEMKHDKIDVPSNRYAKSVQFDISLQNNGTEVHELAVPVTITMPVPKGIDVGKLTIIHYSEDGTYRSVSYINNGNGTISFTVTHFSSFVFASSQDDTETPDDNTEDQIRAFVSRMYTVALGRDAEKAGLDDWSEQLINHTNDGAGLARGFICSAEFTNKKLDNDAYINTLYKTFFDREPDADGKTNWLTLLNRGTSRNEVLAGFVNSLEFANLCDKYGIARGTMESNGSSIYNAGVRNYVLRMYTKCLKREGETLGVEDWSHRINTKTMSPEAVAKSFFSSQEFLNKNLNNEDYVETLYETFMDRASDAAGKADWVGKLNAGVSRQSVLEGFSRSPEFAKIMQGFGLK